MRCPRLLPLTSICLVIALISALLLAQSNPIARANQPSALPDVQELHAGTTEQPAPAAQKPPVSFETAVSYSSGGYDADSIAIGDVNGDGKPDIVVANACADNTCANGTVSVLLGNGDGTFQSPVSYSSGGYYATSVAIGDVNGDGYPDLVVANVCPELLQQQCNETAPAAVDVLIGNGDGTFQAPVSYSSGGYTALSVAVADVNGDGHLDIVVANYCQNTSNCTVDGTVGVLLNNGDGTFQPAVSYDSGGIYADSVAIGDVNGDGYPDLIVVNAGQCSTCSSGGVSVLLGNGNGTFQPAVTYSSGAWEAEEVAIRDLNGDGHPDLVVTNFCLTNPTCNNGGIVSVLLNNGDGTFRTAVTYGSGGDYSYAVAVADVNGDGKPDLVALNQCVIGSNRCAGTIGVVGVLLGNGDGTFQSAVAYKSGGRYPVSVAVADVNGDDRPDLLVSNDCTTVRCNGEGAVGAVGVLLNNLMVSTTTKVASSPNPSQVDQPVTFTATITASSSVPNGSTVTFYKGATEIGTGTTTNGVATLTTSFSTAGKCTIKASYPGDAFHKASSGSAKQVVNP